MHNEPEPLADPAECPDCGKVYVHREGCPATLDTPASLKARVHWLQLQRDHELAALAEVYHPRQRALHDEYAAKRDAIYARYSLAVDELRAAA